MIKNTPPMGWNTWNTFGADINEDVILSMADVMVEKGFLEKGYEYLVIDDCWSLKERDHKGRLQADPKKFPHGMKYVADYVHGKGLKFGMYSCAGNMTCAGYPASFEHEYIDAETFASWGVDFLKYDYCYHSPIIAGKYLYRRMGNALANCGRDILFSACSWGADETHAWIKETGAHMWRSTGDINDSWRSVKELTLKQDEILPYAGVGCFNDMDMLVVGMYGKGNVGFKGMSDIQYRTHFSIWCLFGSPLMMGADIRDLSDAAYDIMTNEEMIAIDQDPACRQLYRISSFAWNVSDTDVRIYCRALANGDLAIGVINFTDQKLTIPFNTDELGVPMSTGKTLRLHDVWSKEDCLVTNGTIFTELDPYDCRIWRAKIVDLIY